MKWDFSEESIRKKIFSLKISEKIFLLISQKKREILIFFIEYFFLSISIFFTSSLRIETSKTRDFPLHL